MEEKKNLLKKFCEANRNKFVTFIFANGFQLHGKLMDFDGSHIEIETTEYGPDFSNIPKTVLLSQAAISTYVPGHAGR